MDKVVFHTAGNGLWSDEERAVRITDIKLGVGIEDGDKIFGELRVYFDRRTWDTMEHGLIYTDRLFVRELQAFLDLHGLPGKDVYYSEQGMQGDDYVSCDAGTKFYKAWMKKFGIPKEELVEDWFTLDITNP